MKIVGYALLVPAAVVLAAASILYATLLTAGVLLARWSA